MQIPALEASSFSECASFGCVAESCVHEAWPPHDATNLSAIHETGLASVSAGPKFQAEAKRVASSESFSASIRYPRNGSSTNCHGRNADGLRMRQDLPARNARIRSGMSWSLVQSPPPMAFP